MPLEQHPTDPDKLIMRAGNYNLQKPWVNLTVDELIDLERKHLSHENLTRAIEAKLKEKNT